MGTATAFCWAGAGFDPVPAFLYWFAHRPLAWTRAWQAMGAVKRCDFLPFPGLPGIPRKRS
jgi:hypothetical protein